MTPVSAQEEETVATTSPAPVPTTAPAPAPAPTTAPTTAPATAPSTGPTDDQATPSSADESTSDADAATDPPVCQTGDDAASGESSTGDDPAGNPCEIRVDAQGQPIDPNAPDPAAQEENDVEPPPEDDVDIPAPSTGRYSGQGGYEPEPVLVSSVADAKVKVQTAEETHRRSISVVKSLRLRLKRLGVEREALDIQSQENLLALEEAEVRLRARALSAFVRGGANALDGASDADTALAIQAQQTIVDIVFEDDQALIIAYQALRLKLSDQALSLFDRTRVITEALTEAEGTVEERRVDVEQAIRELEAFEAGSQIYISGVVFPILWPYDVPLIDSYGFPRMMGTADQHWHEGIDLFAPSGTPLVATERGAVTRIGSGRLGGLRLWLRGESGTDWYYAHLSGFADGLTEGQIVEAGEVIGYVGNTGNAVGTPPHLHMQVHPNGGEPVNPYPLLKVVSDRELADAGRPQRSLEED